MGSRVRTLVGVWVIIFQVCTDIVKMMVLLCGITPYAKGLFRRFGGGYCLHLQSDGLVQYMGSEALDLFTT